MPAEPARSLNIDPLHLLYQQNTIFVIQNKSIKADFLPKHFHHQRRTTDFLPGVYAEAMSIKDDLNRG